MKAVFATITLFFFLLTFSTKTSSSVRADLLEPVVDTNGKKLRAGKSYYVLSAIQGVGGLSFDRFGNITRPHVVVQERRPGNRGKRVKFLPLNSTNKVIYTSSTLNIKFSRKIPGESGVWKITRFILKALNVATNGVAGRGQSHLNWFRIAKAESRGAYKILALPNPKSIVWRELVIFFHGPARKRYVGLANTGPFQRLRVKFKKAHVKESIDDDADDDDDDDADVDDDADDDVDADDDGAVMSI